MRLPWLPLVLCTAPLWAQNEEALRRFFEGKTVRVKLDMPGTHDGIDIHWRQDPPLDFKTYSQRIKNFGVSIVSGDSVLVTTVRVKSKNIEFQLAGGGYGTFGDDTGGVSTPTVAKSSHETDLEKDIGRESDPHRRDEMKRELSRIQDQRHREESRERARTEEIKVQRRAEIAEKRRHAGSRFNVWFPEKYLAESTPTPDQLMSILNEWVEFSMPQRQPIRRGMSRDEVHSALGAPVSSTQRSEGSLQIQTERWEFPGESTEVDFLDGLVIKFRTSSK